MPILKLVNDAAVFAAVAAALGILVGVVLMCVSKSARTVAVLAVVTVTAGVAAVVGLASTAHASGCGRRLTLQVDGVPAAACGATVADAFGATVARSYLFSGLTLTGQVLTSSGGPTAGAPISVVAAALDGSAPTIVAAGHTNAGGRYRFRVPRGPSRLLTVENLDGGSLMVRELVAPNVGLWVHAHTAARLVLGGRVLTDSSANPTVVLQDLTPDGWETFGVTAPSAWGGYRYGYRSDAGTVGDRFQFRATTMPTGAWQTGVSGVREATVRP
jgi:hypothetical protein